MDNKKQKFKKRNEKLTTQVNTKKLTKSLLLGSLIATFIAICPFLFYLYESVPETRVWNTFLFTYDSAYWEDANYAMWVLTSKAIPLILLSVWFFTCRHWWYHTIIVPIAMYIYQIIDVLSVETLHMDKFQLIYLVPVMAIIIPSIYLIRARMFDKLNSANKTLVELEEEFAVRPKNIWSKVKQYF